MHVAVFNTQKRFPLNKESVAPLVKEVIACEKRSCHEVAIHFVGTKKICSLHASYFNDPSVTDCISFPIDSDSDGPYSVLGEVFVCPETAFKYVQKHGGNLYEEMTLYVVHGLLHLLGYDDIEDQDRQVMRERESFHMNHLKAQALLLS